MTKRKSRTPKRKSKPSSIQKLKRINYILLFLVIALSSILITYYFMQKNSATPLMKTVSTSTVKKEPIKTPEIKIEQKIIEAKKNFEEYTEELEKEYIHEVIEPKEQQEPKIIEEKKSNRPKLAIVIDDVTLQSQVDKLNTIDYTVNMSFLPPTKLHPNSAKIAQNIPFYLIHFPMEATSFKYEEANTLHIKDSYEKIESTVKHLKTLYPNATYTNNHTGSKFTADHDSMDKLFRALKKYNFTFLDSRTTSKTVAKEYAVKYGVPFLGRNIFLDNNLEYDYIVSQLQKAIKIAHKTGYAIAIGHPHDITIKVLREAKPLLEGLDIVYLNEMPTQ